MAKDAIESFFKLTSASHVTREEFEFLKKIALKDLGELGLDS